MNEDVICLYYSRSGNTKKAVEEIAEALSCETVALSDRARRGGPFGALRCGMDAMRKRTRNPRPVETPRPLSDYKLVIIGTPVWAGRCSSVVRGVLERRGAEIQNAAYVLTHRCEEAYRDVFGQMDRYVPHPHVAEVSLRPGSTGYHFWRDTFVKSCADFLAAETQTKPESDAEANMETEAEAVPEKKSETEAETET